MVSFIERNSKGILFISMCYSLCMCERELERGNDYTDCCLWPVRKFKWSMPRTTGARTPGTDWLLNAKKLKYCSHRRKPPSCYLITKDKHTGEWPWWLLFGVYNTTGTSAGEMRQELSMPHSRNQSGIPCDAVNCSRVVKGISAFKELLKLMLNCLKVG